MVFIRRISLPKRKKNELKKRVSVNKTWIKNSSSGKCNLKVQWLIENLYTRESQSKAIFYEIFSNIHDEGQRYILQKSIFRSSHQRRSGRKGVLGNFAKLTGKRLEACNFIKKETLAQVFSCEFCKISDNTFFTEHLRWLLLCFVVFRQQLHLRRLPLPIQWVLLSWRTSELTFYELEKY